MRATCHFNGARVFIAQHHVPLQWCKYVKAEQRASLMNSLSFLYLCASMYFTGQSEELPVLSSPWFAGLAATHTCETHK